MTYPTGTLLIDNAGITYRAHVPWSINGFDIQEFTVTPVNPAIGNVTRIGATELPESTRIIWEPSGIAYPIPTAGYATDQDRISIALALVDDLAQDAGDLGDKALTHTLTNAYHAIERFRIIPGRPERPQPSHADGSCGCPDPYCQA